MTDTPSRPDDTVLLSRWSTPFGVPPFESIAAEDFRPAFEAAILADRRDIDAIIDEPDAPSFENTILGLERSGKLLDQVGAVFFNLTGSHTNDTLQAIEREVAPVLSAHRSAVYLDDRLFRRIDALFARRADLGLGPEEMRVLERYHRMFVRMGAGRSQEVRDRLAAIGTRLATLGTAFSQNVLADESSFVLPLREGDLAGLPAFLVASAKAAADARGIEGHAITLSRSSIEPFLTFSERRDLRETAFRAWIARGANGGPTDNLAIIAETVALRAERAKLLGYPSYAHFRLEDAMAKTPDAAADLLRSAWEPAKRLVEREAAALQALIDEENGGFPLAPWDWRFYAERLRKRRFDIDEAEIKPYLPLHSIIDAAFETASRLFGLTFTERPDLPRYHPDVRAWEVRSAEGRLVGVFLGDYFARPSKRSGAWMSSFRSQHRLDGDIRPIVVNVLNFSKGAEGDPSLLSFDDARTLFHEFGHALHGLLSDVTYPLIAGTSVPRDFVEFPSQLFEHWLEIPDLLRKYAVHHETGAPMPEDLLRRVLAARQFNQGFATVEYTASALVDLELHLLPSADNLDAAAFERATLSAIGMPAQMVMRHRTPHFTHVFSGDGYASAYYSYLWSEVLDADGFDAFREAGDPFDPATAHRLWEFVYSAGDRREPAEAYQAFRGRAPRPDALLRQRGLLAVEGDGAR